ncbi:MAG: dTDP-4-dehydrorhamnose reductase [Deltaproteobacteria bacterium]|jgi:dTDP-4-dehydrorhamnose reductase|nr:dTDP-4-dehydrorhamnose reductase [Deltaproteobacteria bacterium]
MRILLIGLGQLGRCLAAILPLYGQLTIWDRATVDLRLPERLAQLLDQLKPNIIFNAAAYTRIDAAEQETKLAMAINGQSPAVLAAWAKANGASFVHYSTDYVFDGRKLASYVEEDPPNPLNVYGRSKWAGDEAILKTGGHCYIFRTSWLYGTLGRNFPKTILSLAKTKLTLEVVDNQIGAPTSAEFLALASAQAVFGAKPAYGLYHLTASNSVSWHGLACYLVEKAQRWEPDLKLKPENITPVKSLKDYPAARPANSVLSNQKFFQTFGLRSPSWDYYMDRFLVEYFERFK